MAIKQLTGGDFAAETKQAPLAMVDFWADWCGPCRLLSPTVETLGDKYPQVLTGKVNVDQEPELARSFGIMSIPTVVFLKEGREVDRRVGLLPEEELEAVLRQYL